MSLYQQALALAAQGFHVFPLIENSKLPLIAKWQDRATRDPEIIRTWWVDPVTGWEQSHNIGICTTRFYSDKALVVVDVDNKGDKKGDDEILRLEIEGNAFPHTLTQWTPSGGSHLIYFADSPVKQGASVLGPGLDIRSRGGYIVAAGSRLAGFDTPYGRDQQAVARVPEWIVSRCGLARDEEQRQPQVAVAVAPEVAQRRALEYLVGLPTVTAGSRNHEGFKVAARLKDEGVLPMAAADLMSSNWKCEPPLDFAEIQHVVNSAYEYGRNAPGSAAPEAHFKPIPAPVQTGTVFTEREQLHPLNALNQEYAFLITGGGHHILWETTDDRGLPCLDHLNEGTFHKKHAATMFGSGKKAEPLTDAWMRWQDRRSYDRIAFAPGETLGPRTYNLWRGFAVEPAIVSSVGGVQASTVVKAGWDAVDAWKTHLKENVCRGNESLATWLTAFFAHMVQKPNTKPLVALVFRGGKGVGKNALIELGVHGLLGSHSRIVTDRRYLVGNFNSHLENLLCITFDEAFWSGDKQAEGILKGLITGKAHIIEMKGKEPYAVENKCRVVIIGNEDWLVPASHDERRFAVFDVGDGRKQDRAFFESMRTGMEAGGYSLLLRYLLDIDITGFDSNEAPATEALMDQKNATLAPVERWWLDCLREGAMLGSEFGNAWQTLVSKERVRSAFTQYCKSAGITARRPDNHTFGRTLGKCLPFHVLDSRVRDGKETKHAYKFPELPEAREKWCQYIGHQIEWNL